MLFELAMCKINIIICDFSRSFLRFQLMLYKSLWDSLVAGNFPTGRFYDYFSLNPHSTLSEEIRETTADAGFPVQVNTLIFYKLLAC